MHLTTLQDSSNKKANKWVIFTFVAVGVFMSTLDGSIVNIALPSIMKDLSSDFSVIGWVVLIYLLTVTSFLLCFGRLSDIKGRRIVFTAGLVTFAAGSLCCALSQTAVFLIASRSLQGFGAAMIMACSAALVTDTFPAAERGKAMGAIGTVVAAGLTSGPAIGGFILTYFNWRMIFIINIPIGFITALIVFRLLKKGAADKKLPEPFDWPGAVLLVMSISFFLLFITAGSETGYMSLKMLTVGLTALISTGAFIFWEKRIDCPLVDLSLFKIRLFSLPVVAAVLLFMTLFIMNFLMPFYLTLPRGLKESQTGYMMIIPFAFLFVMSPVSGILSDRFGSRVLCTIGMAVLMISLFALGGLTKDSSLIDIGWRMALAGLGTSIFLPPNSSTVMSAVPPQKRGLAGGVVAAARNLGMVTGVALAGTVFNYYYFALSDGLNVRTYTPEYAGVFMTAFKAALNTGGFLALLGIIISALRGPENKFREPVTTNQHLEREMP